MIKKKNKSNQKNLRPALFKKWFIFIRSLNLCRDTIKGALASSHISKSIDPFGIEMLEDDVKTNHLGLYGIGVCTSLKISI